VVRNQVGNKLELEFLDQGEKTVKNIAQPVHVYFVNLAGTPATGATRPAAGPAVRQLSDKPSVAILPFSNMSNDPEQEFFSDGITEDIITDLSNVSGLFVLSRNTVFTYKGRAVNMEQIARQLGVAYVVEGSVRKAGQKVRINTQLIEGSTGGHVWAARYDRDLSDLFAVQDENDRRPAQGQAFAGRDESDRAGSHQCGQTATRAQPLPLQGRSGNEALGRARRDRR
jgi:adenylate cyclase